jgi:hypothetical protein
MKKYLTLLAPPVIAALLFYVLAPLGSVADAAARSFGAYWRKSAGRLTARLPFSVTELLAVLLILWFLYAVIRFITGFAGRRGRRPLLSWILTVFYAAAIFLWVGCAGYFARPVYDGVLTNRGITTAELTAAAEYFRDGANRTADSVHRAADGGFDTGAEEIILLSSNVFRNLTAEFPRLQPSYAVPKIMLSSALMSRTGFTGVYFALAGEANVNAEMPRALLAATVAHELAHSRGVAREDAANFFGIAACVTSDIAVFEYSGYLDGLLYLGNALYAADPSAYYALSEGYSDSVRRDLKDNSDFWADILAKNDAAPAMAAVSAAVNTAYDGFMRSNGQDSGLKTYGECVNLLAEWVTLRKELTV